MFRQTKLQSLCREQCTRSELRQKCGETPNYLCILQVEKEIFSECKAKCATYENSRAFASCEEKQTRKCVEANQRFSRLTYRCGVDAEEFCEKSENHKLLWRLFG
ncbi:hypothetical protein A9K97_gp175 [Tokyovirus A1]|uniref:hypothetical protein n=1 Tax=Tokyovirus A1 TaxID=1826170 RepID=UPI0007A9600F|nr:hypothetical protein A9K97_gp175 [Tokyovirus A1]BAU80176.1 hypothetical protein [Tokyovirus A1]